MYINTYKYENWGEQVGRIMHMCKGQQECTPAPQLTGAIAVHHCGGGRI